MPFTLLAMKNVPIYCLVDRDRTFQALAHFGFKPTTFCVMDKCSYHSTTVPLKKELFNLKDIVNCRDKKKKHFNGRLHWVRVIFFWENHS